ncbi:MAG: Leucine-rich repeat (LRR) protein [Limisphaerales bacterium]
MRVRGAVRPIRLDDFWLRLLGAIHKFLFALTFKPTYAFGLAGSPLHLSDHHPENQLQTTNAQRMPIGFQTDMAAGTNTESTESNLRRSRSRWTIAIALSLLFASLAIFTIRSSSQQISQAELVSQLKEAGARPFLCERFDFVAGWKTALGKRGHLRSLRLLIRLFPQVICHVNFESPILPVELLSKTCQVTTLLNLTIICAPLTTEHLEAISNARNLRSLSLGGPAATPQAFRQIAKLRNLDWLDIENGTITDADLRSLEDMPQLQTLSLSGNDLRGPGLAHLRKLDRLTFLSLSETLITDEHLKNISHLTHLEILHLGEHITDAGTTHIVGLTNLVMLGLHESHIDNPGLDLLLRSYPKLQRLTLFHVEARMDRLNLKSYPNVTLDAAF